MTAEPGLFDTAAYKELAGAVHAAGIGWGYPRDRRRHELVALREWNDAVVELMVRLVDDSRAIGMTWQQIGESLGMSKQGVQQMHKRASTR